MLKALASTAIALLGKKEVELCSYAALIWLAQPDVDVQAASVGFYRLHELGLGASWSHAAAFKCIPPTDRPTLASLDGGAACTGLSLAVSSTPTVTHQTGPRRQKHWWLRPAACCFVHSSASVNLLHCPCCWEGEVPTWGQGYAPGDQAAGET